MNIDQANISSIIALNNNDIIGEIESCYNKDKLKNKISVNGSCNDWKNFDKEIEKYSTSFEIEKTSKDDPMILFFTSGTTSYPKGVIHSFSYPLAHIITAKYWHNVSKDGLHYTLSDTGWAKFFWGKIYGQWLCEAPIFAYDYDGRFIAEDVLDKISKYQITSLCAPATNYRMFNTADLSKYDLSCVKNFLVAGEPFEADSYNKFCDAVSNEIRAAYGMTETTMLSGNLVNMKNKPGTIGKINPIYDYMIVDSKGNIVDDNNIGELLIRPKNGNIGILKGYLKNKEIISPINNGWFNTGDSVFKDDDGYLNFIGRKDDIIKTSGYKVAPPEVEELIMELPFVKECVVIGLPDKIRGAIVSALVVLNDNIKELDDLKVKIQKYIKSKTSPYKYPRKIFFVSEIPKTISGKMDKGKIKKLLLTNAYKIDKKND